MWKDKHNRKGLGFLYSVFLVEGLNLDVLIKQAKIKGIDLYNVKKDKNKRMLVTVNFADGQNFFAIAKELCYNIKKVKDKGKGYPLYFLFKSFGLIIGALIFIAVQYISADMVYEITYQGSGVLYQKQVEGYLTERGITKFSRFSKIDLPLLEDAILADNKNLSFASCKKSGNRLIVELVVADSGGQVLDGDKYQMLSTANGVVESIKVYRGTAMVKVGDTVKEGDLLVDGVATVKEQTVKVNVLAVVSVIVDKEFTFVGAGGGQEMAKMLATERLSGEEIVDIETKTELVGNDYFYKVTVKIRRVISVG